MRCQQSSHDIVMRSHSVCVIHASVSTGGTRVRMRRSLNFESCIGLEIRLCSNEGKSLYYVLCKYFKLLYSKSANRNHIIILSCWRCGRAAGLWCKHVVQAWTCVIGNNWFYGMWLLSNLFLFLYAEYTEKASRATVKHIVHIFVCIIQTIILCNIPVSIFQGIDVNK